MKSSVYIKEIEYYKQLWNDKVPETPYYNKIPFQSKLNLYIRLRHKINKLFKNLNTKSKIEINQLSIDDNLIKLLNLWLGVNASEFNSSIQGSYVLSTEEFVNRVKSGWPEMSDDNIFQALRNVWIMNLIQVIAEKPVELTDSMFAYSMLYPLTDNIMDHKNISKVQKIQFVERLEKRLKGEKIEPELQEEHDIYRMVELIESQYDRTIYPRVYESILEIHHAQFESLRQQYEEVETSEMIHITFHKGAASVIADGFLVLGELNSKWIDFLCGYGIVLQLADDLQDTTEDEKNHHKTLFSSIENSDLFAYNTKKLIDLSHFTLKLMPCESTWLKAQVTALLKRSMQFLISDAIYVHQTKYPKYFYKEYDKSHPIGLNNHAKLKALCGGWMEKVRARIT
ncbi:MAG: class 1 isoprenoid biosynthesis enzyme [Clostridiales bacterium]|nr:class 1 isoprenoid biosynthesis enzyme [Clostridiales bacterium]